MNTDRLWLQKIIELFYTDAGIPIFFYMDGTVTCLPVEAAPYAPPDKYLAALADDVSEFSYCSTAYGTYYGCVRLDDADSRLVLGPVTYIPYTKTMMHALYQDYTVPIQEQAIFFRLFGGIPQYSITSLLTKLELLSCCIHRKAEPSGTPAPSLEVSDTSTAGITERKYEQSEMYAVDFTREIETIILAFVRMGNPEGLLNLKINENSVHPGINSPTAIRQIKNNLIVSATLAARAATDGGLDYKKACLLSDKYIELAESTDDVDTLEQIMAEIFPTFAEYVREARTPLSPDARLQKAIRFIQQNTAAHITSADVAEHVGFSPNYFSSFFKQNMGFSANAFIMRCKLEESRQLLKYTDKTLSEISSYLHFSNQSHFQTSFKKQYGITPMHYRNEAANGNDPIRQARDT